VDQRIEGGGLVGLYCRHLRTTGSCWLTTEPRKSASSAIRRVSGFRFRFYSDDWEELGVIETIVPNWSKGDEFMTGDGRRFRIVGIVPVPDDLGVFNALWKVELVSD
jgi:hypothetical protein